MWQPFYFSHPQTEKIHKSNALKWLWLLILIGSIHITEVNYTLGVMPPSSNDCVTAGWFPGYSWLPAVPPGHNGPLGSDRLWTSSCWTVWWAHASPPGLAILLSPYGGWGRGWPWHSGSQITPSHEWRLLIGSMMTWISLGGLIHFIAMDTGLNSVPPKLVSN